MSHAAQELVHGAPRECFVFVRGTEVWRYVGGETALERSGLTYAPAAITRATGIERAQRGGRGDVDVTLPIGLPVAQAILTHAVTAAGRMFCTIQRFHATDGETPELVTIYTGAVARYTVTGTELTLTLRSAIASLARPALRVLFQRTCNNTLYDHLCAVDPADHTETVTVTAVDGATATVEAAGALTEGAYTGGVLTWGAHRFHIERHAASDEGSDYAALTLSPAPGAELVDEDVEITKGCDKTRATCAGTFNNLDRFLGFDRMPLSNPWQHGF